MGDLDDVVSYETKTYFTRSYDIDDSDEEWYVEVELEIENSDAPKEVVLAAVRALLAKVEEDYA